ncbi:MAG: AAA family ATPase [Candidatus Dadabacteria bacterium]|nr:AAA family ATPase [Candidatus Dadabacteria bacterium]
MKKEREKDEHPRLIEFLLNQSSYPHKPRYLRHVQTHASHVFIVPPYVYKIKKPVNFGFLDFSTLEKRKHFCEKEVELNSRICEAYLGVEEISIKDGDFVFGKGDETVEYAVKMRKLPERYFLKNLLIRGKVTKEDLVNVVEKLVEFYNKQPVTEFISDFGRPERVKINIDENFSLSERFIGKTISKAAYDAIKLYNNKFFEKKSPLFNKRIEKGFIRDCHGDLHLEHINLSPEDICIYDCIEFNERFRYIDIASDIAFLGMDLDFNGHCDLANFIVHEISKRMKDETIFEMIDFYKCYRAYVRGKVESIRSTEPEIPAEERNASEEKAKRYFRLALRYALFGSKPALIVTFGLIGTGKSTLAHALSRELSCKVISSDEVRKEIMGVEPTERKYEEFDKGIYSPNVTDITYRELLTRGRRVIESGRIVIIDASFSKRGFREMILHEAEALGVPYCFIETKAGEETLRKRLINREIEGKSVSDARWEIFERFREGFEEPDELPRERHIVVSTDKPPEETLAQTLIEIINKQI